MKITTTYRDAIKRDGPIVAKVFRATTRHDLPYLPELHTDEDDVRHFTEIVEHQKATVAEVDGQIVGFSATLPGHLNYLYILPNYQGNGIGSTLLKRAMDDNTELQLWAFQKNTRAREFYEHFGFHVAELTDGQANEEHEPDVRYIWKR